MRLSRKNNGLKKRIAAFVMAVLMTANPVLPCIDALITAYAEFAIPAVGDTGNITMNVNSWCIDDSEMVGGGLYNPTDVYMRVEPTELGADLGPMFFLGCALKAGLGDGDCAKIIAAVNECGIPTTPVDSVVFKQFLHSSKVRGAYAWADAAAAKADEIFQKAGLISAGGGSGSSGPTVGGKTVPSDLSSATSESSPKDFGMQEDNSRYVLEYSPSDAEFYDTMSDGHIWYKVGDQWTQNPNGWSVENTGASLVFTSSGGDKVSMFKETLI